MNRIIIWGVILIAITGCTAQKSQPEPPKLQDVSLSVKEDRVSVHQKYDDNTTQERVISQGSKTRETLSEVPNFTKTKIKNSKQREQKLKKKPIYISGDKEVQISVESIPLNEFIDVVFGQVLKENYTMTEETRKITTPITLNMATKEPKQEVFNVVRKLLQMNGVSVEKEDNVLFFSKKVGTSTVTDSGIFVGYGKQIPKELLKTERIGMFVPMTYTNMGDIQNLLRSLGVQRMQFSKIQENLFFTVSEVENIRKLLEIVEMLDRPTMTDKKTVLVSLDYIDAEKFAQQMKKIFEVNGIKVASNINSIGIVIDPIKEIQSVLVVASQSSWIEMLLYWKDQLDVPEELGLDPRLYIYHVKNRRADELSEAINSMLGIATVRESAKVTNTNAIIAEKKTVEKTTINAPTQGALLKMDYTASVTADLATNILMLKLKPQHYKTLLPIIEQLDVLPLQTLVEVTIAEVDMTDTFSLGFEWAITNEGGSLPKDLLTISGGGSGLGAVFTGNYLEATLNAYAEEELLDIVSKPKILILNNETGKINVGTQVPIITSETSASDIAASTINRNVTYRTTGVDLGVSPTINSEGILTMNIDISLSEAQLNDTSDIDSPIIIDRSLSTVAVVKSTDTIMIGGLISTNISDTDGGVPLLKDIPWLGSIFKSKSTKKVKTELVILIRPTIILSPVHIDNLTRKFQTTLEHLKYL